MTKGKPGRPRGALTSSETIGVKRAREWANLRFDSGTPSLEAARAVAEKWQARESDIYRDFRRHEARLVGEINRETEAIEADTARITKAMAAGGRPGETSLSYCLSVFLEALRDKS